MTAYTSHLFFHVKISTDGKRVIGEAVGERGHQIRNYGRQDLDGVFVEWSWNGTTLKVRNDRYGFYPLYYFSNDTEIAISDSIDELLNAGAPRELDDAALGAFLRLGHFLGDDTPFRSIRMIPPSADLEWTNGRLNVQSEIPIARAQVMTRRQAMDAYVDLFRAAIARRVAPTGAIVPLSGGRDSRHIVLELCRQGRPPTECVTARLPPGEKYKTEVEVATQLCAMLGIAHHVPPLSSSRKAAEEDKNRRTSYATTEHGWFMPVSKYLGSAATASYDGMAGDVLSAGHFLTQERHEWFEKGDFRRLFVDMQWGLTEGTMLNLLPPNVMRRFSFDSAMERFEIACKPHVDAPNPIGSFSIFNRTRRVACLCAYALQPSVQFAFSPFLDNDLFDFLSSLPAELFQDHDFHTETIRYAYPEYAEVPFAESKPALGYAPTYRRYAREVAAALLVAEPSTLFRKSFVLPRLARCLVDSEYSPTAGWLCDTSIYLMQIERASGAK